MIIYSPLDLRKNQITNFVVHVTTDPSLIASPVEGQLVYDSTAKLIKIYNGSAWIGSGSADLQDLTTNNGVANNFVAVNGTADGLVYRTPAETRIDISAASIDELNNHSNATTSVHGIADTTKLIKYDANSRVAIGSVTADETLEVNGSFSVSKVANTSQKLLISHPTNDLTYVSWRRASLSAYNSLTFRAEYSDGTSPVDIMTLTSTGVGIGTTSPGEKLEVAGYMRVGTGTAGRIYSNANTSQVGLFGGASFSTSSYIVANGTSNAGQPGNITFTVNSAGGQGKFIWQSYNGASTWTNRMIIDSSGNVGIGTSSPSRMIHVFSSTNLNAGISIESTVANSNPALVLKNDAREWRIFNYGTNGDAFAIYDSTAAAFRQWIDSSGNVGIGTTSPEAPLHIVATTGAANYDLLTITASEGGGYDFRDLASTGFVPGLILTSAGLSGYGGIIRAHVPTASDSAVAGAAAIVLDARKDGTGALSSANILAVKNYTSTLMTIDSGGHFGFNSEDTTYPYYFNTNYAENTVVIEGERTEADVTGPDYFGGMLNLYTRRWRSSGKGVAITFTHSSGTSGNTPWAQERIIGAADNSSNANATGRLYLQTRYYNGSSWVWRDNLILRGGGNNIMRSALSINSGTDPLYPLDIWTSNSNAINWAIGIRNPYNANDTGYGVGIKFHIDDSTDGKWSGIAALAENAYANNKNLVFYTNQTEQVRITSGGSVGIGTTSPGYTLDVNGTGRFTNDLRIDAPYTLYVENIRAQDSTGLVFKTDDGVDRMILTDAGYVGIGTTSLGSNRFVVRENGYDRFKIEVTSGSTVFGGHTYPLYNNTYDIGLPGMVFKTIFLQNSPNVASDRRFKTNIVDSDLGLEFINSLRPVKFDRIEEEIQDTTVKVNTKNDKNIYGLIAQELEDVINTMNIQFGGLLYDENSDRYSIRYEDLISPLIKAVQELTKRVEALETNGA